MYAIRTFGRSPAHRVPLRSFLGADPAAEQTAPPEPAPSCAFTHYLGDEPTPEAMTHGTTAAITAAVLVGAGWLLGGIIPVVGRPIGSLVGAGLAGATTYAGFSKWKTDGGTTHKPGTCP